ncbi:MULTISPECIES: hypothetical protein [unclassified Streptomyces]|uniref:hypothetical protein n=1 Tax=unclassified Streptomyces TaxID=2593676 RepID=UPI001F2701E1|nr:MULTISPECIES: hypothetical protein [unclassified Streptomyces]
MARTAHHPSLARRRSPADWLPGDPHHAVVLYDLRYDAGDLAEAAREARRPRPRPVRRAVAVHSLPRHRWDKTVAHRAAEQERRARQRLRERVGTVLRLVNTPDGALDLAAAESVDVPPARHRHSGVWFA